jgi:hypothetical protein
MISERIPVQSQPLRSKFFVFRFNEERAQDRRQHSEHLQEDSVFLIRSIDENLRNLIERRAQEDSVFLAESVKDNLRKLLERMDWEQIKEDRERQRELRKHRQRKEPLHQIIDASYSQKMSPKTKNARQRRQSLTWNRKKRLQPSGQWTTRYNHNTQPRTLRQ